MRTHTSNYKNAISTAGREIDTKITYEINGVINTLNGDDLFGVTPITNADLLKTVMKEVDFDSKIQLPKETIINVKNGVKVNGEYEYIDFGNYIVSENEWHVETNSYKHICYDKMLRTMVDYNGSGITYPINVREYINELARKCGLVFAKSNGTFANYNVSISGEYFEGLGYTFRDVLDYLSQIVGGWIYINSNDQLDIKYPTETNEVFNEDFLKNINISFNKKFGEINSVVFSRTGDADNIYRKNDTSIELNGLTEIKISDNPFLNGNDRSNFIDAVFDKLNGIQFYIIDVNTTGITYLEAGDLYKFEIGGKKYPCLLLNSELHITKGLDENIYNDEPQTSVTDYKTADKTDQKINQTYLIVDKQNQQIEAVISQTDEQNQKIAQVTQTVEELNSKISDIADITTSAEDTDAKIELNEINQSEPIRLVVRPIGESISNLVVSSNMLISDNLKLKQRVIRFTNTDTNEVFDYSLPNDLFYYDSENYDEFILDYDGQSCVINKKVGLNKDGTVYLLETPTTIEYEFPTGDKAIILTEGNYTVEILGYGTGYIFTRLMAKNIYTTQFYTKAETDSIISQTSQSIDLSVNKKLSNYSTTTEMNSAITLKANEITSSVSSIYATKNELSTAKSEIKQTTDSITSTVSTKVGNNEIISKINQSAEQITINANKLNLNGYLTISNANNTYATQSNLQATNDSLQTTNNNLANNYSSNTQLATSGSTIINGDNIITGTIKAKYLDTSEINSTTGTIGGWTISSSGLTKGSSYIYSNGRCSFQRNGWLNAGNNGYWLLGNGSNYKCLVGDDFSMGNSISTYLTTKVISGGGTSVSSVSGNVGMSAINGSLILRTTDAVAMRGNNINITGDNAMTIATLDSNLYLRAVSGSVYIQGGIYSNSSSKNMKENIVEFNANDEKELYDCYKNMKIYNYDYKEKYGNEKNQIGFILEQIDEKLYKLIDGTQNEEDENIKHYNPTKLAKINTAMINILIKKIESLEEKLNVI